MVTLLITVLPPSIKLGKMAGEKKKPNLYIVISVCLFFPPFKTTVELARK